MNAVEALLLETMQEDAFQRAVSDDCSFIDNMIDQNDLNNLNDMKEEKGNADND